MKIQVRNGIFETNSSSVHAICIPRSDKDVDEYLRRRKNGERILYKFIFLKDWYDFEIPKYYKHHWLYNAIIRMPDATSKLGKLKSILHSYNYSVSFEKYPSDYEFKTFPSKEICEFVDDLLADDKKLFRFFNSKMTQCCLTDSWSTEIFDKLKKSGKYDVLKRYM